MVTISTVDVEQRLGAGLLFLLIAVAVLFLQPAAPVLTAVIAGLNLLLSAGFLLTVGRDTADEPSYDVGFWLLAMVVALGMYLAVTLGLTGEVDTFRLLLFIIGFGIILGVLADLRARVTR
jgi:hypothetical protein